MPDLRATRWQWCEAMLPRVSRTFALCIRFLPDEVRRAVLLSYLLCRVADTVEDAPELAAPRKLALLDRFAASLTDPDVDLADLEVAFGGRQDPDARLAARAHAVTALLHEQPQSVREAVIPWVSEMCRGMAEFANDRPVVMADGGGSVRVLETTADLDRYCYYVAGTVGHLLTALFTAQRSRIDADAAAAMDELAEDFGAGLQLVNILVDVARDRQRGVSYVPAEWCRAEGVDPARLLDPSLRPGARRVLQRLVERAHERLARARRYCLLLPRTEYQLRLFCVVPYYLALRTLTALENDQRYPEAGQRVKIGRSAVYRTVTAARVCAASNHLLRAYAWRLEEIA
jgi:farnesyl-diphosphate farnesyltransferase